jgi:hypothetical protein
LIVVVRWYWGSVAVSFGGTAVSRTFQTQTPLEALLVEQALLLARQLQKAADAAPDGKVLAQVEAFAVPAARELARKAVEAALQAQAKRAEKKGPPTAPVRAAARPPGPSGAAPATS